MHFKLFKIQPWRAEKVRKLIILVIIACMAIIFTGCYTTLLVPVDGTGTVMLNGNYGGYNGYGYGGYGYGGYVYGNYGGYCPPLRRW